MEEGTCGQSDPGEPLQYAVLLRIKLKAYRSGNWRRLTGVEKAFFNATLLLAKLRGRLVNHSLVKAVRKIVSKLLETPLVRILQTGREKASSLLTLYRGNGVFKWAPDVKNWLKDPEYVFWLGVRQLALLNTGYG
ncbi:MAG: hypothetical protein QW506_01095 [Thermoproteota archaeon]|nr:hypothetical protein [Candidatus Brockarchaeota archaeon]